MRSSICHPFRSGRRCSWRRRTGSLWIRSRIAWCRDALRTAPLVAAELTHEIAIRSRELDGLHGRDSIDRFLVATCHVTEMTLRHARRGDTQVPADTHSVVRSLSADTLTRASVGTASFPEHAVDAESLFWAADTAMYSVKDRNALASASLLDS